MYIEGDIPFSQNQSLCLWDLISKKQIIRQPFDGFNDIIYFDTTIIVKKDDSRGTRYYVRETTTGKSLGEIPEIYMAKAFGFSLTSDGSELLIFAVKSKPDPIFAKYRLHLESGAISKVWEQPFVEGKKHEIYFEGSTERFRRYYLVRPDRLSQDFPYLLDGVSGQHHPLPHRVRGEIRDLFSPAGWSLDFGVDSFGRNRAGKNAENGNFIHALDEQGTQVVSPDGRYFVYYPNKEQDDSWNWLRRLAAKCGIAIKPKSWLVILEVMTGKVIDRLTLQSDLLQALLFSPASNHIVVIDKIGDRFYLQLWSIPLPTRPWWLIGLISCLAGTLTMMICRALHRSKDQIGIRK